MGTRRRGGRSLLSLTATIAILAGCHQPGAKQEQSYFTIHPVTRELPPPCLPPAVAEKRNGEAVFCFELGVPQVDAGDVESAALVTDRATSTPSVEFRLSSSGTDRFNAMARMVGVGGQAAFVVDGAVVSAPRFETTDFPGSGVVTGLTNDEAGQLVKRLNRR
jgi:preprotein translocase subunit SecD